LTPRRHLLAASVVLLLVGCWPWYVAAAERSVPLIVLLVLAAAGASFASGVFGAVVADLFPTRLRYSGVASAYNVSFTAFISAVQRRFWQPSPSPPPARCRRW
jgi:nitrate/nitrite transporter NarK